jgi:hypothetical protein
MAMSDFYQLFPDVQRRLGYDVTACYRSILGSHGGCV